jgi:broad specificity phosphatase PhoE
VLRHGQTDANANCVEQGSADFSRLTDLGKQQAVDAFQTFQRDNIKITSIYSSPLSRTRATLGELRRKDESLPVRLLPPKDKIIKNLREIDLYDWEGQEYKTLEEKFPSSWQAWKEGTAKEFKVSETKKNQYPVERYPLLELWERADLVWDEIFLEEQQKSIENEIRRTALIVAHGSLGQALLGTAMGWDVDQFRVHEFPNCGIAEVDFASFQSRPKSADKWRWIWPTKQDGWNSSDS